MTSRRNSSDYLQYLKSLHPRGWAALGLIGGVAERVLAATADAFADFDARVERTLVENFDPCTADVNATDWLRATGVLNDPCLQYIDTCAEARAVLQAGSVEFAGQEQGFYTYLLTQRGIDPADISYLYQSEGDPVIFRYRPLRTGEARCGYTIEKDVTRYYMEIIISQASTYPGYDSATASLPWVVCLLERFKPAHMTIEYTFT